MKAIKNIFQDFDKREYVFIKSIKITIPIEGFEKSLLLTTNNHHLIYLYINRKNLQDEVGFSRQDLVFERILKSGELSEFNFNSHDRWDIYGSYFEILEQRQATCAEVANYSREKKDKVFDSKIKSKFYTEEYLRTIRTDLSVSEIDLIIRNSLWKV